MQASNRISFPARISGLEVMTNLMAQHDLEPGALWTVYITIPQGADKCISIAAASAFDGHGIVKDNHTVLKKPDIKTLANLPPSKLGPNEPNITDLKCTLIEVNLSK